MAFYADLLQTAFLKKKCLSRAGFRFTLPDYQLPCISTQQSLGWGQDIATGFTPSMYGTEVTFAHARPMYRALDTSLLQVPDSLSDVLRVTASAIERARKLGVEVNTEAGDSVTINGRTFTPHTDPVAWDNLKSQGLVDDSSEGQPLTGYLKVRSELLNLQRSTADAARSNKIGDEVRSMNASMDAALYGKRAMWWRSC